MVTVSAWWSSRSRTAEVKTDTARAWAYVRDDAPFGGQDPPAALFRYSRNRSGVHPVEHLRGFMGILQADAYAGFNPLYASGRVPGPVTEASCSSSTVGNQNLS